MADCQRKLLLLIADYDEVERKMLVESLQPISAAIRETDCGEETISLLMKEPFDCLITDYILPDYDALALIDDIRKLDIRIPIVVITRNGDEMLAVKMMKAGAHDYIPKDKLTSDMLIHSVTSAIRLHKASLEADYYRMFYETAPVGFYTTTVNDGTFLKANDSCVKLFGYSNFEQLRSSIKSTELYTQERREYLIQLLRTWDRVGDFEIAMRLQDGTEKWVNITARLCKNRAGCGMCLSQECIEGSIMDITERKLLEMRVKQYEVEEVASLQQLRKSIEMRLGSAV